MDWQQIKQLLIKDYDFLSRAGTSDSSQPKNIALHPIVQMSVSLTLKAMFVSNERRRVILIPNRLNCAKWLAALCTMEIMKQDYERGAGIPKFSRGQKLLLNRCVVEYVDEEFDE